MKLLRVKTTRTVHATSAPNVPRKGFLVFIVGALIITYAVLGGSLFMIRVPLKGYYEGYYKGSVLGALIITYTVLGSPYDDYSLMGPKALL